jgi:hypothetical protein
MGREIRRVPPDWDHPRQRCPHSPWNGGCSEAKANGGRCFQPLHDDDFETVARRWLDEAVAWDNGTDPDCAKHKADHPFYWQWAGDPPDPKYYRPKWTPEQATHVQMYETVSEGTPVTPHFATKAELVDYLVEHGDYWDEHRAADGRRAASGWDREVATRFVEREWAPSLMMMTSATGVLIHTPRDGDLPS